MNDVQKAVSPWADGTSPCCLSHSLGETRAGEQRQDVSAVFILEATAVSGASSPERQCCRWTAVGLTRLVSHHPLRRSK